MFSLSLKKNPLHLYRCSSLLLKQSNYQIPQIYKATYNLNYTSAAYFATPDIKETAKEVAKEFVHEAKDKLDDWAKAAKTVAGESKSWTEAVKDKVKEEAVDKLKETAKTEVKDELKDSVSQEVKEAAQEWVKGFSDEKANFKNEAEKVVHSATDTLQDWAHTAKEKFDEVTPSDFTVKATEKIKKSAREAVETAENLAHEAKEKVKDAASGPTIQSAAESAQEWAQAAGETIKEKAQDAVRDVKDWAKGSSETSAASSASEYTKEWERAAGEVPDSKVVPEGFAEKIKDWAHTAQEKVTEAKDATVHAAEATKEKMHDVSEGAHNLGEKAKEKLHDVKEMGGEILESAKETLKNVADKFKGK